MTCKGFPLALISVPRPQTLVPSEIELFIPAISSGLRISMIQTVIKKIVCVIYLLISEPKKQKLFFSLMIKEYFIHPKISLKIFSLKEKIK